MTPDERYLSWVEQIDRIANDVVVLHHHRQIWQRVREITQEADLPPSTFFDALSGWYATSQMTAIRRLVDRDSRTLSLRRLLDDLIAHPRVMSLDRHVALWLRDPAEEWTDREGRASYERFADASGEQLDVAAVTADRERAVEAAEAIKHYVDQRVAHHDLEPVAGVPTWDELNAAVDTFAEVVRKYAGLLTAQHWWQFEPVIQYDWEAPFRRAWLTHE